MDNYKLTPQRQWDAVLDTLVKTYAREIINTNLLIDLLEKTGADPEVLNDEVNRDLVNLNNKIREQIYVEYGYFDPNALK